LTTEKTKDSHFKLRFMSKYGTNHRISIPAYAIEQQ
jgi:hypothetical protein